MKQKILIIEDKLHDYIEIVTALDVDKYDFIPWYKDKDNNGFKEMQKALNRNELIDFVTRHIEKNYNTLRVVICDLFFEEYNIKGHEIIKHIRNNIEINKLKLFPKLIPIIAYTNHSNKTFAQKAILNGATHNIQKGQNKYFSDIVDAACDYFRKSYIDREINTIEKYLESNKKLLIDNNKLISSGFGNIEVLIKGNHLEAINKFNILFKSVFDSLDNSKKTDFFNKFKEDIENSFSEDEIKRINTTTWDQIKTEIKSVNQGGGFKAFVDATYDILDNAGMLEAKGKIIGSAIKGIFGILNS